MAASSQVVDPRVSRRKFVREVGQFRDLAHIYRGRGWFLAEAAFPLAVVVMAAVRSKPAPLVLGVRFDYTDYDLRPPSVRLVDPITAEPFTLKQLPMPLLRLSKQPGADGAPAPALQPLMVGYGDDDIPFLCLPGVREYHDHPAHSGDAWELHRTAGAGRLVRLLEVIDRYGASRITGYQLQLQIAIAGFQAEGPPE